MAKAGPIKNEKTKTAAPKRTIEFCLNKSANH
jgi:hypothetical protein